MKRMLLSLLLTVLLLACIPLLTTQVQAASESDLSFTDNGSSYSVTDCKASASGDLTIPSTYNGKPVTSIGDSAFEDCSSLTAITIPDSVTSIGSSAFFGCSSLTAITIPDGVTSIGGYAFYRCSNLTEITIPDSVTNIGNSVFRGCSSLTEITIPDSVTSIGDFAFRDCSSLTSVTIGDSVTNIGDFAFRDCSSLTSVTIGDSVTNIGDSVFRGCSSLTEITIPDSVTSIGDDVFYDCSSLTAITIPDGVTSIGSCAFSDCSSLTSIIIPDSVISIGGYAFYGCRSLTEITIPDSVTYIGSSAFYYCSRLTAVYITDVAAWCNIAFYNNTATPFCYANALYVRGELVTEVVIPDSITNIGNYAFYGCRSLTEITIPDSVTYIGSDAFRYCSSLTSIIIPDSVTSIGSSAFMGCSSLAEITIPDSVTSIGSSAFKSCISLEHIYYKGTDAQRDAISISTGNDELTSAIWHCNACIGTEAHLYSDNCDTTCNVCGKIREAIHYYIWVIDKANNCGVDGVQHQECTKCHDIHNADTIIAATDKHTFSHSDDLSCDICNFKKLYVAFDLNGGIEGPESILAETRSIQIGEEVPKKNGYVFNCWQTTGSHPLEYQPGDTVLLTSNTTFVALWIKNCTGCNGEGLEEYLAKCTQCYGKGTVLSDTSCSHCGGDGIYQPTFTVTCTSCNGSGKKVSICPWCGSSGGYFSFECSNGHSTTSKNLCYSCIICGSYVSVTAHTCSTCGGWGTVNYCTECGGDGETTELGASQTCYSCSGNGRISVDCPSCKEGKITQTRACSICNGSCVEAPHAPTISSATANSVILNNIPNGEYSMDGVVWQDSPIFENLEFCKEHYFYQRYAKTDTMLASASSEALTVTVHNYDSDCDTHCNGCTATRVAAAEHAYTSYLDMDCDNCGHTRSVIRIGIASTPNKTSYLEGKDSLDVSGGKITIYYDDGEPCVIDMTADMVSGFDNTEVGTQTLTVTYEKFSTAYDIEVIAKTLTSIAVTQMPANTSFVERQDELSVLGGKITLYYNNGTIEEVNMLPSMVTGFDNAIVGLQTLTVTYEDKICTYTVQIIAADYTVIFLNWDGSLISSAIYHRGDVITVPSNPTKAADHTFTYAFAGWDKEVVPCDGDTTYRAIYEASYIMYTVTFKYQDGTIISQKTYHYGDAVDVPEVPAVPTSLGDEYTFDKWDREITQCNADATYIAQFKLKYQCGDLDKNGVVDNKDVEYLLWYTLFPEDYSIDQDADFEIDGVIDNKDVEYLLWYTLFPEEYPLKKLLYK